MQQWQRNVQKKRDAHAKLLFCLSKPIAFLPLSLPSPSLLRKLPIGGFVTGLSSTEAPLCCSEAGEKEKESMQGMIKIITFIGIPGGRLSTRRRENWPSNDNITVADIIMSNNCRQTFVISLTLVHQHCLHNRLDCLSCHRYQIQITPF